MNLLQSSLIIFMPDALNYFTPDFPTGTRCVLEYGQVNDNNNNTWLVIMYRGCLVEVPW